MLKSLYWRWCSHVRGRKHAGRLKMLHCNPDVGAHKQLSSTWGSLLCRWMLQRSQWEEGKCVNMSVWEKKSSILAHAALHNLDKGASVGSEVYFLLNLPCFFLPLTQHLSCLVWTSVLFFVVFCPWKQKTSQLSCLDSAQRNFLFFCELTLAN